MKELCFNRKFFALAATTVVGDNLLLFYFTKNTANDLLGFVLAAAVVTACAFFIKFALKSKTLLKLKNKPFISWVLFLGLSVAILISLTFCLLNLSAYVSGVMLKGSSIALPFIAFLGLSVVLAFSKREKLFKFSLLIFPLFTVLILLMFGFSLPFAQIKYLIPYKEPTLFGALGAFIRYFLYFISSLLPLSVLGKNIKNPPMALSFIFGLGFVLISFLNTLLVFGSEFASTLIYPYSSAVSTASIGHIFSRLDIFLYIVCFFCGLIKAAVCLFSFRVILKQKIKKILY